MKKIYCLTVALLACLLAFMPATAGASWLPWETGNDAVAEGELASAICSYMLEEGDLQLDELRDAAFVFAYWTPETTDEFTLGVFGNANEDGTIDVRDLIYIREVISGKKPETDFSDAKYDGEINRLDVEQTKSIILGNEEELVVVDDTGEAITISKPIENFVYHGHNSYVYETLRSIDVADRIIGITHRFTSPDGYRYSEAYFPELCGLTDIGLLKSPDYEVVNTLKPDLVITDAEEYYDRTKTPDTPVISLDVRLANFREATMKYGYILNKVKEAREYINWYNDWEDKINEKVEWLSEDEKPLVYIGYYKPGTTSFQVPARDNYRAEMVHRAGGKYIGDEIEGDGIANVDAEWVISRNPDVIIFSGANQYVGYDIEDPSEAITLLNDFLSRPEFAEVNAVKNNRVYLVSHSFILCGGASGLIGTVYYANWIHPDLFASMDAQEMHQEFVTDLQQLNLNVKNSYCVYSAT